MAPERPCILIAGGAGDPHLQCLHRRLIARHAANARLLVVGSGADPMFAWDLRSDTLFCEGVEISPRAAFVRRDVFAEERSSHPEVDDRAHAWYAAVLAWVECHPEVRFPNRPSASRVHWKPAVLHHAARCGLRVPDTLVGNDMPRVRAFAGGRPAVAKPIDGGEYCQRLDEVLSRTEVRGSAAAAPAIVQPELVAPELRVYGVGERRIAFRIDSAKLDYRSGPCPAIELVNDVLPDIVGGLGALMKELSLDFCAADFKTCPISGELLFLEINDAPMFALFDEISGGAISDALAELLGCC
jgi:hypothetical protein